MNLIAIFLILCLTLIIPAATADVNIGLVIGDDGVKEFHLSIGEHYGVEAKQVERISKRSIPDDELAVVFFIAKHGKVAPMTIVDLRLEGKSWMEICLKFRLDMGIFYIPFDNDPGPPYGKAYGYFKNKPEKKWHKIVLDDIDIVNIVNLKLIAARYNCSFIDVVKMRKQGKNFAGINSIAKKDKEQKEKINQTTRKDKSESDKKDNKGKGGKK